MNFAERLLELRKKRDLSQERFGEKIGVSKVAVSLWEANKRMPSIEKMEEIADFFGVDIDYLMGKESVSTYFIQPEAAELAQELVDRPELKVLFNASRDLSKEDIQFVVDMIERMK